MSLQVGVDLVSIERIARIAGRYQDRFLARILSPCEKEQFIARGSRIESLAAVFAAKEAVLKALGCGIGPAALCEVEIISPGGSRPMVRLQGKAADIAVEKNIKDITVSMTHEPPFACAVAAIY